MAGILFLFDVAQRRLDWLREPEKQEAEPEPEEKKTAGNRNRKKTETPAQAKTQEKAADVLWQNMQKKKRL